MENQACHADVLITEFRRQFPSAFDRDLLGGEPPSPTVLNFLAQLRGEPERDDGSSADEGAPGKEAGWKGQGKPMQVGVAYTAREYCDGQTLASPGRWPPNQRRYPASVPWSRASGLLMDFARKAGTTDLLTKLSLGRVESCPFDASEIQDLRQRIIQALADCGLHLNRAPDDRKDVPVDFRLVQILLTAAEDPEVALGNFAPGVRVGPGVRLPRQPALFHAKRKWRLPEQADPEEYLAETQMDEAIWKRNYSSLTGFSSNAWQLARWRKAECPLNKQFSFLLRL